VKIYTKKGDDGTTGLLYGGRVRKDTLGPEAYGTVDEAVAALGVARAHSAQAQDPASFDEEIIRIQRDLFVVAAELATAPENRSKLEPGVSLVTEDMVAELESRIDEVVDRIGMPDQFIVPGQAQLPAYLDFARTVIRRAERRVVELASASDHGDSLTTQYLNRLADYLYMLVRAEELAWEPSRKKTND
jgi:cob(I)alamin adenosyltransferase